MKRDLLTVVGLSVASLLLAFGPAVAGGEKGGVKSGLPSASPSIGGDVKGDVKTDMPSASPRLDDQKTLTPERAPEPQQK